MELSERIRSQRVHYIVSSYQLGGYGLDGAEGTGSEAVRPGVIRSEALRPEAVAPEAVRPEAVGPVRPEAVGPKDFGSGAVGPKAVGPEAVGPEAVRPEEIAPRGFGPGISGGVGVGFGTAATSFALELERLLTVYPPEWVELALVETLVERWMQMPLERGVAFLGPVSDRLQFWANHPLETRISPTQFQMITGLDPTQVFEGVAWSPPEDAAGHLQVQ